MPALPALVAPALVLINPFPDELGGPAIVHGNGGRDGAAVEDLAVHLAGGGEGVVPGDKLNEGDAAGLAGGAVLEDGDAGDLAEGGEEGVEVGVGEGVLEVRDVECGLGGGQAS
uniref:Uncharacterized protein MANES_S019300 n=1 Tax=Rhizophora mucronata TaxID=61149 RepID=A0A2P2J8W2_RHIMU